MSQTSTVTPPEPASPARRRGGRWIDHWEPEDETFWQQTGRRVARRNLVFSIIAENIAFSVWLLWSISSALLVAHYGFGFSAAQMFFLVAVPNFVGSVLRIPYTFAVPKFGGRNWTVISGLLLLIPTLLLAAAVSNPSTPYWAFLLIAATAGVGGGNFASSMTNISFFYPDRKKGLALAVNAAGGNVGVSIIQLGLPVLVGAGGLYGLVSASPGGVDLARAGYVWAALGLLAAAGAWFFMNNLSVSLSSFRVQISVVRRKHTWIVSWLYVGTFGSFIGFSAAFPLLIGLQFPGVEVADVTFLGALVGSAARPVGGWLADRLGGARVTLWNFAAMAAGTVMVIVAVNRAAWPLFLGSFLVVFVTTGIGNGSTFRMIPMIFQRQALAAVPGATGTQRDAALARGRTEAAAAIGLSSAAGAFGGFVVVATFGVLGLVNDGGVPPDVIATAFAIFLGFYVTCVALTWWHYTRRSVLIQRAPNLSSADV
ncbi:NNP family nitrate/nitrite transporter-like MFS transporter [Haloactinopolyspora alba]|uniref:NNP family nitrate/nitrite transporter-like MFS transporter n=1 Tax=Haloactinopolyspora alba TaxID=648780 RepID=A0A2P8EFR6_9ACTN|nr:MFS transporter [Haloactinopolyspora alba]PSL08317.1 NNP family nitrate/nitrite transporter-like MFS transporter [Haloactinopolyspora alba]